MLTRFELFRKYARICEENAERSLDARSVVEWQDAAREWSRIAREAANEDHLRADLLGTAVLQGTAAGFAGGGATGSVGEAPLFRCLLNHESDHSV